MTLSVPNFAATSGITAKRSAFHEIVTESGDLNSICSQIEELRHSGMTSPVRVNLGADRYTFGDGNAYTISGVAFVGIPGVTQIEFTGVNPAKVTVPDLTGYPNTKTVTTGCLGVLFRCDRFPRASAITFQGITFVGITSTPLVAGDYYLMGMVGGTVKFDNCEFTNEESATYDSTSGSQSPYKSARLRGFNTLDLVFCGEDRWIEPNPELAVGCERVEVQNCRMLGEPLNETIGTDTSVIPTGVAQPSDGRITAFHFRKCGPILWTNNTFGKHTPSADDLVSDVILTANVQAGDQVLAISYDPFTKNPTVLTYVYTASATPTKYQVTLGSSKEASMVALAQKINTNFIQGSGSSPTDFIQAQEPDQYLGAGTSGVAAACRIRSAHFGIGQLGPANPRFNASQTLGNLASGGTLAVFAAKGTDAGNVITVRAISDNAIRSGYWMYGLVREDCFGGSISTTSFGTERFARSGYHEMATQANVDFFPDLWSEAGHHIVRGFTGETCAFVDAGIHIQSAGWVSVLDAHFGLAAVTGTNGALVKFENGTHASFTLTMTANPTDTEIFTIVNDGHGGTKVFEADNNGAFTGGRIPFTIGATADVTMENIRRAVQSQFDAHVVKVYPKQVFGTGPWTLEMEAVTWGKRSASVSITEGLSNTTIADTSNPWKPRFAKVDINAHALANVPGGATFSIPYVWAENIQQNIDIRLISQTCRQVGTLTGTTAQAITNVVFGIGSVVAGGEVFQMSIDSIATGPAGTLVNFWIRNAPPADDLTNKNVNSATFTTSATQVAELVRLINLASSAEGRAFGAGNLQLEALGQSGLAIYDGVAGVNASFVTKVQDTGGDVAGGAFTIVSGGAASVDYQGLQSEIVLSDVNEAFVELHTTLFNEEAIAPKVPIYIKKSGAGVVSRLHVRDYSLGKGYSLGRFGNDIPVLQGANMVASDIVVDGGYAKGIQTFPVQPASAAEPLINPAFAALNTVAAVKAMTSTSTFAVYMGKAPRDMFFGTQTVTVRNRVTTAYGNDGATPWAEVAIAKGAVNIGANPTLTVVGFTNVAATFNSNGQKSTAVALTQPIFKGDDLWVLLGNKATTAMALRAQDVPDDIQTGYQAVATAQPSLILGIATAFTIEGAAVLAPWVTLDV